MTACEFLDRRILAAHESGDESLLALLYWEVAQALDGTGRTDEACFFAVQAYALALSAGIAEARDLRSYLVTHGREV